MLFNSFSYVLFLWAAYVLWWTLQKRRPIRHATILLASYWFYGQAHWAYVPLLIISSLVDFVAGARIHQARMDDDASRSKRWLWVSLIANLGLLGVFKYFDFFSGSLQAALGEFGVDVRTWRLDLILPVGISFYTFQSLSYSLDIYWGRLKPTRHFVDFAMFVAFFPQLIAGPIVRARDFLGQLVKPVPMSRARLSSGLYQILLGLAKKLLIADIIGAYMVDPIMRDSAALASLDVIDVLVLGAGFMIQLYGDFAGYSDVAIGSARLMGFELRRNFAAPLRSRSIDEFWQRWHISMTSWFRDYVFAPLAGGRPTMARRHGATMLTFLIVGLWHGAAWTFVVFGLVHGLALTSIQNFRWLSKGASFRKTRWWGGWCHVSTLIFACVTGLLIRAPDMGDYLTILGGFGNWSVDGLALPWQVWCALAVGLATNLLPSRVTDRPHEAWVALPALVQGVGTAAAVLVLFGLRPPGTTPFIYFQF